MSVPSAERPWPSGEWTAKRFVEGHRHVWEVGSDDTWPIVTVDHVDPRFAEWLGPEVDNDEVDASARLIAAAPDLFEALESARDYVGDVAQGLASELTKDVITEMAREDLARIDAALAKARGEVA